MPTPQAARMDADPRPSLLEIVSRARDTALDVLQLAGNAARRAVALVEVIHRDGRQVAVDAVQLWSALRAAADEAAAAWQATPRIAAILKEVARVAAAYQWHTLKAGFLPETARAAADAAFHTAEAARVTARLEALGGGILKAGQLLSARTDLLPAAWTSALAALQDRVAPEAPAAIAEALAAAFGDPASVFADFDPTPVAAASIAQVHRARLHDGRDVAVKVRRPGITTLIAQDQRALTLIGELVGARAPGLDLAPFLAEIARGLGEELDLRDEAAMGLRFAAALSPDTRVPTAALPATEAVLVMDFIEGQRLPDFLRGASRADKDALLTALARATADAILVHGLIHADPHPGNFLVTTHPETGRHQLVMLDFGAALALTDAERHAYLGLLPALFGRNEARVAELLAELGFSAPDPSAPAAFALGLATSLVPERLADVDLEAELERGLALARTYPGLVVPPHFVRLMRALGALGGLFLAERPDVDLQRLLMQSLMRGAARRDDVSPEIH
jgi:ubiquinone biosynthesis protein